MKKKALRQYEDFLRGSIVGKSPFPLSFPIGKVPKAYPDLLTSVTQLIDHSKATTGSGYTLVLETRKTRKHGPQSIPEKIYVETATDYLALLQKETEFSQFRSDIALIQTHVPALSNWASQYPLKVVEKAGYWPDLLKVCQYFQQHPRPNLYIRELPIAVHTKFIEEQQEILRSLLEEILPADQLVPVEGRRHAFEKRF
ncbi:MAG: DUF3322 domain-containing protein, partial [Cyanobacteria bacterium P01_F01_bin.53]